MMSRTGQWLAMSFGFGCMSLWLLGCSEPKLTDAEKWWLDPPTSATHIAFERDGKWGYRDGSGKVVVPPRFDYAVSFPGKGDVLVSQSGKTVHLGVPSAPLGRVRIGTKWGYIDAGGKLVIPPRFDRVLDFYEDLTAVMIRDRWGFIDRRGKIVIPPQYEEASPFLLNVAHVKKDGKWLTIDPSGKNTAAP